MVPPDPTEDSSKSVSTAVIEAIAEEEGLDAVKLEPPLGTELDPDALDRLFQSNANSVEHVTLTYCGYQVTVFPDGRINTQELS